ncbi:MAG: cation transporter [Gemmatimonadetes bacterium]|nr:cation transporter [Gemmatimonadota bacterium]
MTADPRACSLGGAVVGPHCTLPGSRVRGHGEPPQPHGAAHKHGHEHEGAHGHAHDHSRALGQRGLLAVLALTGTFMVAEFVGGLASRSLALMADAAHMLTDVASLALSLFALWFARRPATPEKTYGYVRLEILAALLNGVALLGIAGVIGWEAYQRLSHPVPIQTGIMLVVAVAGLLANVISAVVLHRAAGESLNVRGAYLHVVGDLLGSAGAVAAALIIMATGWLAADPILSFLVALLVVFSAWKLLRESVDVLLEAVPPHIDLGEVRAAIDEIPGVDNVHDLHVWTVTSGFLAMSGHAVVAPGDAHQAILEEIHHRMRERFGIRHATIQLECAPPGGAARSPGADAAGGSRPSSG